jgi:hypothetical protein
MAVQLWRDKPFDFMERLKEIDMFFQENDPVHQTMRRVADALEGAGIPYAVMGGMAVNAHGHQRTTGDVDFLLTPQGFAEFRRRFVPHDYEPVPKRTKRFADKANGVTFDILVTGLFPGSGKPGPVAFPDPTAVSQVIKNVSVIDLPTLIQLKLAARRHQDFGDVVNLIRVHNLDESFQPRLHPSVQRDFIECLEEKRREDEYEERQDRQLEEMIRQDEATKEPPYDEASGEDGELGGGAGGRVNPEG